MSDPTAPDRQAGVLISGAFGTGKSLTAEEMATILEARGLAYAAMDLDWLAWFDTGRDEKEEGERVMLDNVVAVVHN
jgi:pantothenate kinase-related protein Tda10